MAASRRLRGLRKLDASAASRVPARTAHWVGRGRSGRWQDSGNWASSRGGRPGFPPPRFGDEAVLDDGAWCDVADLRSCPASVVTVVGFSGRVRLPGELFWQDFYRAPWWHHPLARLSTFLAGLLSSPRVSAVVGEDWRWKVQVGSAVLCASAGYKAAMVLPRALGGVTTFFWVPVAGVGTGTWDGTTDSLHWATSSGGTGGLSGSPTSSDTVTFDSNSGSAATVTYATGAASSTITVNKSDLTLTHSAGSTCSGAVTLTAGTLNLNGQTCSWGSYSSSNSNVRTLTMGASAITITASAGNQWDCATVTNLTITANTATITMSGANAVFRAGTGSGSVNWNGLSLVQSGSGTANVQGNGSTGSATQTFANYTRTGTAVKTDIITPTENITCTGTCTLGGNTTQGVNRLLVQSNTVGTSRTITAAAYVITGDVDFQDINLAYSGGASWTNAGSAFIGDCGGNSGAVTTNATVSAAQTWSGDVNDSWSTTARWTSRVPLPQDDVAINTAFSASRTVTYDMLRSGRNIDWTGTTGNPTWHGGSAVGHTIYGSLTLVAGLATSNWGNTLILADRRGGSTIASKTVVFAPNSWAIQAVGGSYQLSDDFNNSTGSLQITDGTFNANGFNVTTGSVTHSSRTRTLTMGSGTWTLKATGSVTPWNMNTTGLTFSGASVTIQITATDSGVTKTFAGGGLTYGTLRHTATGSAALTITGNNTGSLDLECTTARTVTFPAGGSWTVPTGGTYTATGASGQLLSLVSSSPGTGVTLNIPSPWTESFTSRSADVHYAITTATLTATQTQTAAMVRTTSVTKTATQTQSAAIVRNPSLIRAATQTQTASIIRAPSRIFSAAQTQACTLVRSISLTCTATQTQTAAMTRTIALVKQATQTQTASMVRGISLRLTATQTQSASIIRSIGRVLTAVQTQLASLNIRRHTRTKATATITLVVKAIAAVVRSRTQS